jgi:hypothetical protein
MEGEPRLPVTLSAQRYYLVHIHLPRRVNFPRSQRDFPVKADYFVTLFFIMDCLDSRIHPQIQKEDSLSYQNIGTYMEY